MSKEIKGQCLCGGVQFEAIADRDDITACHCSQCRAWSGHYWASVSVPFNSLVISGEDKLGWRRASDYARRGFCRDCGSALFWHGDRLDDHKARIAVAAGALNDAAGLKLALHIFTADKGDYYDIADGLPQEAAE